MRTDQQWTVNNFNNNWNWFKNRHQEFASFDYKMAGEVIMITGLGSVPAYNAGYVWDIGSWSYEMMENHFLNVLRVPESQYQEKRKMSEIQKERMQEAKEKGEMWARFGLAINPNIQIDVVQDLSIELAGLYGFGLTKETMEFVKPVIAAYREHQENSKDYLQTAIDAAVKLKQLE